MKVSLYEGTSLKRARLIMTDERSLVLKRKRERDISRKGERGIKRFIVEVPDDTEKFDAGKGGGPWANYDNRQHRSAAPRVPRNR